MEPDIRDLVKKNLELTKENNALLRKMRRGAIFGGILKLIWLAIIVGVPLYLYINYLAPVLDQVVGAAQTVQEVGGKVESLPQDLQNKIEEGGFGDLLNFFNKEN